MAVYLDEITGYDVRTIERSLARAIDALGIDLSGKRTALIKPNLVTAAKPRTAIVTHPAVVEAVVACLRTLGIESITVADGPGVGLDVDRVFRVTGYAALASRLGVRLVNLNAAERRERPWKYGTIGVPAILEDADLYINAPKLKTHGYTTLTLSIKNHKGILSEADKKLVHELGLHEPLIEQAKLRPPDLIVMDGIVGVQGDGPLNGRPVKAAIFGVASNMLEIDAVCARLAGFDPESIKHLAKAMEEGLGSATPEIIGRAPATKFVPANEEYGRVLNIYSWRDCTACSMCIDSFSAAVHGAIRQPRYWFTLIPKLLFWATVGRLHIVQGRRPKLPAFRGKVICLGKCTREFAREKGLMYVPGCPPRPRDVQEVLRKEL